MGKVYIFAGFMIVLALAGVFWLIWARAAQSLFKKREKK